ncbi:MAG: hypothetical protein JEZ08_03380 [Clostridiales bacterium]|nr:hypothetical protein [Clostridiales bacterium]
MDVKETKSRFLTANDVANTLDISMSKAYQIIRDLNKELNKDGYYTVSGKISRRYFESKVMM